MRYFCPGAATPASISYKIGDSPVTEADFAVDAALKTILRAAFPRAGWLSEESEDDPARLACQTVLVLDPIDGTRAFMRGDPCFAVALALLQDGRPVAGVIHAPALGETFAARARRRRDAQRRADPRGARRDAGGRARRRPARLAPGAGDAAGLSLRGGATLPFARLPAGERRGGSP